MCLREWLLSGRLRGQQGNNFDSVVFRGQEVSVRGVADVFSLQAVSYEANAYM